MHIARPVQILMCEFERANGVFRQYSCPAWKIGLRTNKEIAVTTWAASKHFATRTAFQ
jgi:hypothetical protein